MKRPIGGLLAVAVLVLVSVTAAAVHPGKAAAEDNGIGRKPAMGWSSWSFYGHDPTSSAVEAQARALVHDGLKKAGYTDVLVDDFWYVCPGSQGPEVGRYGHWMIDTPRFPEPGEAERDRGPGPLRPSPGSQVRALRDAGDLPTGGGQEQPHRRDPRTGPIRSPAPGRRRTTTAAGWSGSTTPSGGRRPSSTPGPTSSPPGASTT